MIPHCQYRTTDDSRRFLTLGPLSKKLFSQVDAFGNILGSGDCPSANVGVQASVLSLVKTCVCINLLHNGLLGVSLASLFSSV